MPNRRSTIVVPIYLPSNDGRYWGRYPNGDKPPDLVASATVSAAVSAQLSTSIRLAGSATDVASASAGVSTEILLEGDAIVAAAASAILQTASASAPDILFYANTAGPTSGGENNNGTYVFLYMKNAGAFADWGSTSHVTIGGVEVAAYCSLFDPYNPKLVALGIKGLAVQVGALTGLTPGTAYPIVVTTLGGTSNANNVFDVPYTFTPQPGTILFVDPVNGNNANAGTFAAPLKDLQTSAGTAGAFLIHSSANATNGMKPGTHVIMRGGTYTTTGVNNRVVDLFRITGLPASGENERGPNCIMPYPGAPGSNAMEVPFISSPAGIGGCWNGCDSARSNETSTSYGGFTGWCQDLQWCHIRGFTSATKGSDGGPWNTQNKMRRPRIIDCEMSWPCTVSSPQGRSAGIEGSPQDGDIFGNYIHDIYGLGSESNTQHGMYFNGYGSGTGSSGGVASGNKIAFNYIADITFGNGIQFFDVTNGSGMQNNIVAYNWIKTVNKHGLNIADNTRSVTAYNNIIEDCGENSIRVSTSGLTGTNGIYIFNNSCYGWGNVVSTRWAFRSESTFSGSMRIENNIFMQSASHAANSYSFYASAGSTITVTTNRWYDPNGVLTTKPAQDATGTYGTPLYTDAAAHNFTLANGSACINAGLTPSVTRAKGFELSDAPQGAAHDIGAYERST